jgi:hypothetical protein
MFVLAPSMVAGPNEVLTNRAPMDSSLPAQFAEETLRVAVYAEDNTSLPLYASGGVSTAHHANLIQLLESNGYAVTALSTQDILDRKLMAASFDVFILPNNLPKDEIVNHVIDYWLAGGGILSFDSGLGYLYYHGMIVPGDTGDYALVGVEPLPHWGFDYVGNVTVGGRHSTAKSYQQADIILVDENTTIHDKDYFQGANSADFVPLLIDSGSFATTVGFALDNTERQGGRIVQLPGNCSIIPAWETSIIFDSVDWLAPRPKARVAIDFSHVPYYGIDSWDENISFVPRYTLWRDSLVDNSFTMDKLYPTLSGLLTADDLEPFDVLVINMPSVNYTATEISLIRNWVQDGGGLFLLGDGPGYVFENQRIEDIIDGLGITFYTGASIPGVSTSEFEDHPVLEGVSSITIAAGSYLNVSSPAYPIAYYGAPNVAIAGRDLGEGRIVTIGDINHLDHNYHGDTDNAVWGINIVNWLSSGPAKVLVYADIYTAAHPNAVPLKGPVAQALNDLDIAFYMTSDLFYFNMSLFRDDWEMVIFDNTQWGSSAYQPHLVDFVAGGGRLIFSTWGLNTAAGDYFGVEVASILSDPTTFFISDPAHPIFNLPAPYGADNLTTTLDLGFGTDALNLTTHANATAIAEYSVGAAITLGVGGNDHPDDVTYMETETGNEIVWTPTADAGPWTYTLWINGSTHGPVHWDGGAITIDVDGVNASITTYELMVYDRLGYSALDSVTLNVTEYIEPPTTPGPGPGGLDPTLLLIIGGAVAGIVIILVVVMLVKKKK